MMDKQILCFILCVTLSLANARNRLFIRDDPISLSSQDTRNSFFNFRSLSEQNIDVKDAIATTTIHGSTTLGYYFTTLYFGTPGQPETLIVDTGSTITTIPCNECGSFCGTSHFNDFFDPIESETFADLRCHDPVGNYICNNCKECDFVINYSEGSMYRGNYKKDYVSLKGPSENSNQGRLLSENGDSIPKRFLDLDALNGANETSLQKSNNDASRILMPFGCTLRETNLFLTQEADGIFGLGVTTNSYQHPPNIVDALHNSNSSVSNAFSICAGQQGGYLAIGGFNRTFHDPLETPKYVPYDGSNGQYRIHWNNVKFNGEKLDLSTNSLNSGRGAYVDSGTTMFYTTMPISNNMNGAIKSFCERSKENCGGNLRQEDCWYHDTSVYSNIKDFYATFGTFTFDFGYLESVVYEWRPEDYLFRYSEDQNYYCTGIDGLGGSRTIFGGTFMKNHDILFDKEHSRLGFIRSGCSADYNLASYPKSRIPCNLININPENEENYIPLILYYGVLAILVMIVFSLCLARCRNKAADNKESGLELGSSPERKAAIAWEPISDQEFGLVKDGNARNYQELPEEFSV